MPLAGTSTAIAAGAIARDPRAKSPVVAYVHSVFGAWSTTIGSQGTPSAGKQLRQDNPVREFNDVGVLGPR